MKLFRNICLGLYALTSMILSAETLFYKTDGTGLTETEHALVYDVMLKHQFPTAPYYNPVYDPTINETVAIQRALDQQIPGVKAVYIPTTLYEIIAYFLVNNKAIELSYLGIYDDYQLQDMTTFNNDSYIRRSHNTVNTHALQSLRYYNYDLIDITPEQYKDCMHYLISNCNIYDFIAPSYSQEINTPSMYEIFISLLDTALQIDMDAHHNNQFVLWRGGFIPEMRKPSLMQLHTYFRGNNIEKLYDMVKDISVSYGNSLCAGLLGEPTACALCYIMQRDANWNGFFGYALPISKKFYVEQEGGHMFALPPLITLNSLRGGGLFFHPRTRVASTKNDGIRGFDWHGQLYHYDQDHLYIPGMDAIAKKQTIINRLTYMYQHAIPLTPQTKELFESTKKIKTRIVDTLKNMATTMKNYIVGRFYNYYDLIKGNK